MSSELTLYGTPTSTATSVVRLTLAEIPSVKYEFHVLQFKDGENRQPAHLARHPWGKMPAIVTSDGLQLYESRAICRYLAVKYHLPLLPDPFDAASVGIFEQAQSVEMSYFVGEVRPVSFECFVKPCILGIPTPDPVALEAARSALAKFFDICERGILASKQYMAGDRFSLVDIFYIPYVERLMACGFEDLVTDRVNVSAWWSRCIQRPTVAAFLDEAPLKAIRARLHALGEDKVQRND
ncbi:hypothetical protein NLG97_g5446 [Lecanicillium saksenae]|uniref:Uncharacterized protein n=1 Tax=Lecanicillium saksenae TaxID=468837 RepID=A0ACC1QSF5_9HYPO|nr:hypothetical protein NLG97_g5446 [Lecanicillium saksenae]